MSRSIRRIRRMCVSKAKISPVTAELKCPHRSGKDVLGNFTLLLIFS